MTVVQHFFDSIGQRRKLRLVTAMCALPPKPDSKIPAGKIDKISGETQLPSQEPPIPPPSNLFSAGKVVGPRLGTIHAPIYR